MEVTGFISIGILVIIQIATFAFYFGKLNGKVDSNGKIIDSVDGRLNDLSHRFDKIEERVHQLEVER
jgi:hypothetical protein